MSSNSRKRATVQLQLARQITSDFKALLAALDDAKARAAPSEPEGLGLERARIAASRGVELAQRLSEQSDR